MKYSTLTVIATLAITPSLGRGQSSLERIATEILGDRFGISLENVLSVRRETREDVWDLGPVMSMSRYGSRQPSEIQRLRATGMGWGQIAKHIGMHPGTFNKLRNQGYFDRDRFWDDVMRRRYSVRQDQIDTIRKRGARLEDVLGAVILGKATHRQPIDVYTKYRTNKNWDRIAKEYKFDWDRWKSVGTRVGWDGASVPPRATPVHPGKSQGKGHLQGHGKGGSKGKGRGRSG